MKPAAHEIIRLAARGDGITADGRHVTGGLPGDVIMSDGTLRHGPHHATPPCRHFGKCGGCQLQHADEAALADFVTQRVVYAARGKDVHPRHVALAHLSPPHTRRRASLRGVNGGKHPIIGYREAGSHRLVDVQECPVLAPALFQVIGALRSWLAARKGRYGIDVSLSLIEQGVDLGLKGLEVAGLQQMEDIIHFAESQHLARLTLDQGYGPEAVWEPEPASISLAGVLVPFPPGAFLQATQDGEAALISAVQEWLHGCTMVADLFSGLGTFAFALAGPAKVLAAEGARDAHLACQAAARMAGRPVFAMHRDLFRNPLQVEELNRFDALVLDPPRAGASAQIAQIAASRVARVAYISCNPATWARDAAIMVQAGYELAEVRPVGQFRWSTHIELASLFVRHEKS